MCLECGCAIGSRGAKDQALSFPSERSVRLQGHVFQVILCPSLCPTEDPSLVLGLQESPAHLFSHSESVPCWGLSSALSHIFKLKSPPCYRMRATEGRERWQKEGKVEESIYIACSTTSKVVLSLLSKEWGKDVEMYDTYTVEVGSVRRKGCGEREDQ